MRKENYQFRGQQLQVAQAIESCLFEGKHLVVEAPTGTGKSLAYLTAAILWTVEKQQKVAISTYSKLLQNQLFTKDLPFLKETLKGYKDFTYELCLGAQNYLCPAKINEVINLGLFDANEDIYLLNDLRQWHRNNRESTSIDIPFNISDSLWNKVCCDTFRCSAACSYRSECFYIITARRQADADILITNHHITLSHIKMGSKLFDKVGAIVFDESHELEDAATAVFGESVSSERLSQIIKELYNERSRKGRISSAPIRKDVRDSAIDTIKTLNKAIYEIHRLFPTKEASWISPDDNEAITHLHRPLSYLAGLLKESKTDSLISYSEYLSEMASCLDKICTASRKRDTVYYKSLSQKGWQLVAAPISVSAILKKKLFSTNKTTVHASATITADRGFTFYRRLIGLETCEELTVSSPFDYENQMACYIANRIPMPSEAGYDEALLNEIEKLLKYFKGRTLILCTNYKDVDITYDLLKEQHPELVFFKQGSASNDYIIAEFKKTPNAVLLGSRSFWQGVDIPGDALQCVILTKLPFLAYKDPLVEERMKRFKDPFDEYQIPKAIITFKQGLGRLIRTMHDKGVIAILDPRIVKKKYGRKFLKALPKCRIISNISDFVLHQD